MTAQVIAKFGRIDILINAAATVIPQDFFKMDDAHLTSLLDQKFNAAARCIRHVAPQMRKHKWGRIINVSGLAGRQPHFTVVPAALNNSAMLNLTKALATELAKDNILINAVVPYIIDTERQTETMQEWAQMTGQPEAEVRQQRISKVAVRRMGRPDEVERRRRLHGFGTRELCRRHRLVCRRRRRDDALSAIQRRYTRSRKQASVAVSQPMEMP